jgi:hypothetical protein
MEFFVFLIKTCVSVFSVFLHGKGERVRITNNKSISYERME